MSSPSARPSTRTPAQSWSQSRRCKSAGLIAIEQTRIIGLGSYAGQPIVVDQTRQRTCRGLGAPRFPCMVLGRSSREHGGVRGTMNVKFVADLPVPVMRVVVPGPHPARVLPAGDTRARTSSCGRRTDLARFSSSSSLRAVVVSPPLRRPASRSACLTKLRNVCTEGSDSRASDPGLRPALTSPTISARNSGEYRCPPAPDMAHLHGCPNKEVSVKRGNITSRGERLHRVYLDGDHPQLFRAGLELVPDEAVAEDLDRLDLHRRWHGVPPDHPSNTANDPPRHTRNRPQPVVMSSKSLCRKALCRPQHSEPAALLPWLSGRGPLPHGHRADGKNA